ncbi:MAG: aminoacyl-tRNA hydrolase [Candidatus Gracilibacteria bacterium]|nr:aminoacyl-tRNA hydrolase [Candidatus Gracilibacteria bacterium]
MRIIIGLGNPGTQYENTRHNIGFMFLDYLADYMDFSEFKYDKKFNAQIATRNCIGKKTILVKPETYMNLSGESALAIINFYKLDPKNEILVVYDDVSMDFGKIRFREKGSAGGHNGIKHINKLIGEEYKRIKIGVGYNERYEMSDWVLSKFKAEETNKLDDIFSETMKKVGEAFE